VYALEKIKPTNFVSNSPLGQINQTLQIVHSQSSSCVSPAWRARFGADKSEYDALHCPVKAFTLFNNGHLKNPECQIS
jgi:hypothetical protein